MPDLLAASALEDLRLKLDRDAVLALEVKVIPRSDKSQVIGLMSNGTLKAKIAAVPEKGKANGELRRLLADFFGVPKTNVEIVSGEASQKKRLRIQLPFAHRR